MKDKAQFYFSLHYEILENTQPGKELPFKHGYKRATRTNPILWPTAIRNWKPVVAVGIFDKPYGGKLLGWSRLANPRSVPKGTRVRIQNMMHMTPRTR